MKGIIVLLITVTLFAGMVGCGGTAAHYDLTLSSSAGGSVTTPGEGVFSYDEGTVVNLAAEAGEGYSFVQWSGDVGTIANINAAETTITMNSTYTISGNFGLFAGGDGTAEYPYQIADWWCLNNARNYLSSHFIVINDLDSNSAGYIELASTTANDGKGWQPIGTFNITFTGTFDGQGYEIRDFFINRPDEYCIGLFGDVDEGGVIQNTGVVNVHVTGYQLVGGLVGENSHGRVIDSYSSGNVTGSDGVGGLTGKNDGLVIDSYSSGNVTGFAAVGGLVGWNYGGTVIDSYSSGNVSGRNRVGGLMGWNYLSTLVDSYSNGSVTGDEYVGGLLGWNYLSTVIDSYSSGSVTGSSAVGGLLGWNSESIVSNSFWDTETSGQATSAGGIGKTTAQMQDLSTFAGATWDIVAVANPSIRNTSYIWNIVDDETYPFLSWEP